MTTEALNVVESTRRRFDGERRNPWNEPECGHHYARAHGELGLFSGLERLPLFRSRARTHPDAAHTPPGVPLLLVGPLRMGQLHAHAQTARPERASAGGRGLDRRAASGREWPLQGAVYQGHSPLGDGSIAGKCEDRNHSSRRRF